jgi:hypothetical protein
MPPHVDDIGPSPVYPANNASKRNTDMTYVKGDDAPRRGHARMKQLGAEMKIALRHNIEAILAPLGREPTELERMQAEMLASLFLQARKLRDRGSSDVAVLREAVQLMKEVPFLRGPVSSTEQRAE